MHALTLPSRAAAWHLALCAALLGPMGPGIAQAAAPADLMAAYAKQAGSAPVPERGQAFFSRRFKGGLFESCSDCHTTVPTRPGRDLGTEKVIAPMAPAANAARFTDASRVEHFFRLNCRDVVGRECTAQEKADLMSWLIGLKP